MEAAEISIEKGIVEILANVVGKAKALAPVAEKNGGRLRSSITWVTSKQKAGGENLNVSPKAHEGYAGSSVYYAIYQEFGTRKMKPQPFMRPAIEQVTKGTDPQKTIADIINKWYLSKLKSI